MHPKDADGKANSATPENWTVWFYNTVMHPKDKAMGNSVGPGKTALEGAIWSKSALFANAYLPQTLGFSVWSETHNRKANIN